MDDGSSSLRSARFVTAGYENALHRMYLYGQGLASDQLAQPFVGLAVADAESGAWHQPVRALADTLKTACWQAGLTPREFVVPIIATSWPVPDEDLVESRELVADSTELVIRGHWYDAVISVAAASEAMFGLAMALVRLRLPGWIYVPVGATATQDADALAILVDLGLVRVVSSSDTAALVAQGLSGLITGRTADVRLVTALTGGAPLRVPSIGSPAMRDLAALLWEAGQPTITPMLVAAEDGFRTVRLTVRGGAGSSSLAVLGGTEDPPAGNYTVEGVVRGCVRLRLSDSRFVGSADVEGRGETLVLDALTDADLHVGDVVEIERIAPLAECDPELLTGVLDCRVLGAVTHPGDVDGALRYHRL